MRTIAPIAGLGIVLALACGGMAPVAPPASYVGTWTNADTTLAIDAGGSVSYHHTGGTTTTLNVPGQAWRNDSFDAGVGPITTTFHVDAAPADDGTGTWKMTVDGEELTRISTDFQPVSGD
jgi:hypothetical protein